MSVLMKYEIDSATISLLLEEGVLQIKRIEKDEINPLIETLCGLNRPVLYFEALDIFN